MLIDERFILLFLVLYFNRTVSHNGNSFQWKINVAIRSFAVFSCAALLLLCSALPAMLCSVLLSFFQYLFLQTFRLLSALSDIPSFCSALILFDLPSFLYLLCSSCSARPLCSMGCLPFFQKTQIPFPPPKNSRHFFKKATPSIYI